MIDFELPYNGMTKGCYTIVQGGLNSALGELIGSELVCRCTCGMEVEVATEDFVRGELPGYCTHEIPGRQGCLTLSRVNEYRIEDDEAVIVCDCGKEHLIPMGTWVEGKCGELSECPHKTNGGYALESIDFARGRVYVCCTCGESLAGGDPVSFDFAEWSGDLSREYERCCHSIMGNIYGSYEVVGRDRDSDYPVGVCKCGVEDVLIGGGYDYIMTGLFKPCVHEWLGKRIGCFTIPSRIEHFGRFTNWLGIVECVCTCGKHELLLIDELMDGTIAKRYPECPHGAGERMTRIEDYA